MRISDPYYYYDSFDFDMVLGSQGDIYDRLMVRFEEIRQSIRIIRQAVPRLPDGPVNVEDHGIILPEKQKVYSSIEGAMNQFKLVFEGVKIPKGEHYSAVEAPNGELGFYIVSDGSGTPYKVKVRAPSLMMMQNLPDLVEGTMIADAVLALGSINIIAGELDR
jgi:NADH-quinone oxidoreductase subunit C/D